MIGEVVTLFNDKLNIKISKISTNLVKLFRVTIRLLAALTKLLVSTIFIILLREVPARVFPNLNSLKADFHEAKSSANSRRKKFIILIGLRWFPTKKT